MPQAESLAFRQPSFKPHGLRKAGDRRGSRISARRGRQEIDDLIWDGDERFLTYANTYLQLFKMFIAIRGEKILLLAYARSCQHMGESETAINAAPRAVSELRKSNFIPRELSSFLKESVKTAHFNLIAASL